MPILNDSLNVWEIGFRWAGLDPDRTWIRIPLLVRDNFRMLMDAILQGHLYCSTLGLEKHSPIYAEAPELGIRYWLDDVNAIIEGRGFNRKLLRWAAIDRWAMHQWCERRGIPLPNFWFRHGWNLDYKWPDDSPQDAPRANPAAAEATGDAESASPERAADTDEAPEASSQGTAQPTGELGDELAGARALERRQRDRIACQEVARRLWAKQRDALKKTIATSPEVQEVAPGSDYALEVVERWLSDVDPRNPANKRGPKRKPRSCK